MINKVILLIALVLTCFGSLHAQSPSIVINEVSNGTSGNKEYIELLVIGPMTNPCEIPATLDLRNWIVDDNNGFLGSGSGNGIASGAFRFKNVSFWSSIPVGTLILIYNKDDYDASLITDDVSMTDGNCTLVIPHNSSLLESQNTLPTTNNSSYPTTGWGLPTSWNPLGLRNGGDGVLVFNPNNVAVPVHSLAYGDVNISNADIGFTGSGSGTVYAMQHTNSDDYFNVNNWTQSNADNVTQTPGQPNNTANASYISTLNNGCQPNSASITPSNSSVLCVGETLTLSAVPLGGTWTSSNSSVANIDFNGEVVAVGPGLTIIEYSIGACSATISIEVGGALIADFTANPTQMDLSNTEVNFTNQSSNATSYNWDFGDNSGFETSENPIHVFPDDVEGIYMVTLVATNASGCSDTAQLSIVIGALDNPKISYALPNVFTPNGDGNNDFFKFIHHENIIEMNIIIFNRWGNVVFESDVANFNWNGKVKNNERDCSEGVYFYKIMLKDFDGNENIESGFLHLLRGQ